MLPFAWSRIRCHGAGATTLRAVVTRHSAAGLRITLHDQHGEPMADVDSVELRPAGTAGPAPLHIVDWAPVTVTASPPRWEEWDTHTTAPHVVTTVDDTPEAVSVALGQVQ